MQSVDAPCQSNIKTVFEENVPIFGLVDDHDEVTIYHQ